MPKALIAYATTHGQTEKIAGYIAGRLRARGVDAVAVPAGREEALPSLEEFDAVAAGGSIYMGRYQRDLRDWLAASAPALGAHPRTAFFSVSASAARDDELPAVQKIADEFLAGLGWQPQSIAHFAGAVKYPRYGWWTRFVMRSISRKEGGGTDTRREYEYTDWAAVDAFADKLMEP